MSQKLSHMLATLTPQEQAEIEIFAAFLLARRKLQPRLVTDDISTEELMTLVAASGSFDWLDSEEEDVYSIEDGEPVQWVNP